MNKWGSCAKSDRRRHAGGDWAQEKKRGDKAKDENFILLWKADLNADRKASGPYDWNVQQLLCRAWKHEMLMNLTWRCTIIAHIHGCKFKAHSLNVITGAQGSSKLCNINTKPTGKDRAAAEHFPPIIIRDILNRRGKYPWHNNRLKWMCYFKDLD